MKKIAVRTTAEAFIDGQYRKPGQIFLVDESLIIEHGRLPSCVQRVRAEAPADELVEARA